MASSFLRFLDHTQRRTTVGRTPLDAWSARRRDLYLTTHNTYSRQISMPLGGIFFIVYFVILYTYICRHFLPSFIDTSMLSGPDIVFYIWSFSIMYGWKICSSLTCGWGYVVSICLPYQLLLFVNMFVCIRTTCFSVNGSIYMIVITVACRGHLGSWQTCFLRFGCWDSFHLDLLKKSINSCVFCAQRLSVV